MLLPADRDGADALEEPVGDRHLVGVPPAVGVDRGALGWPAPERTISPVSASHTTTLVDWVEESTPATSVLVTCQSSQTMQTLPDSPASATR